MCDLLLFFFVNVFLRKSLWFSNFLEGGEKFMARLYNWYIEKKNKADSDSQLWARGVVSGHVRLPDGMFIHTSTIARVTMEG